MGGPNLIDSGLNDVYRKYPTDSPIEIDKGINKKDLPDLLENK